jgi:hypothetical protein
MPDDFIYDRHGLPYRLVFEDRGVSWSITLTHRGNKAGYVACLIEGNLLRISGLVIYSSNPLPESAVDRFVRLLTRRPLPPTEFQGRGLGTLMVEFIVKKARAARLKEIFGVVTHLDFGRNPDLLQWYTRRGFCVSPVADSDRWVATISMELKPEF